MINTQFKKDITSQVSSNQNPVNMKVLKTVQKMTTTQKKEYLKTYYPDVFRHCDANNEVELSITLYTVSYQEDIFEA